MVDLYSSHINCLLQYSHQNIKVLHVDLRLDYFLSCIRCSHGKHFLKTSDHCVPGLRNKATALTCTSNFKESSILCIKKSVNVMKVTIFPSITFSIYQHGTWKLFFLPVYSVLDLSGGSPPSPFGPEAAVGRRGIWEPSN